MKFMKKIIISCLLFTIQFSLIAQTNNNYPAEINQWFTNRNEDLKKENGWLNLVGLYWLEQGKNTFGNSSANTIVFPSDFGVAKAGYFELQGNAVRLFTNNNVPITVNGKLANNTIIFSADDNIAVKVQYKSFHWTIIKREDKIGIRLRNNNSSLVKKFNTIDRFAIDTNWKLPAILQAPLFPSNIPIKNVLGQTIQMKLLGKLIFTVNRQVVSLDAVEDGDDLFVIFGDATNNRTTYGAGRFLIAAKPDVNGKTWIDFNKAYNPPCAFTHFATCPLPPSQNILPFEVTAGEKIFKH